MSKIVKVTSILITCCLFLSCEKEFGGTSLKGYWMSNREYAECKRVYYFDGRGGGTYYPYLSTDVMHWHSSSGLITTIGELNGKKYYYRESDKKALIYTIVGSSIVVSTSNGSDLEYLNYSNGTIAGYKKVTKK